ncbi:MAG TPA: competence/damage-inducible protein A [Candidatus Obscuribacterales bacterium]
MGSQSEGTMPSCEILSIGTELLLGQILNTNSQFLSEELAAIGINCYFQTTIGDNVERIKFSMKQALNRADILLITGGLGPTADDLTTECLAETLGVGMIFDATVMERIESFFQTRGVPMPESNRKQALRPEGSDLLPNPRGTAPGALWCITPDLLRKAGITNPESERIVMTFPGVPGEMKAMWRETAVPYLTKHYESKVFWSCDLKHYGIGESALAEKYAHLLDMSNPTVAPYAGSGECKLRVTARAGTIAEAENLAKPVIDEIISASGTLFYGRNDDTLEVVVGRLLTERKLTIAVAESCTGGLVSKRLTDVPGSSNYIHLNVVTYADDMKERILGVRHETLIKDGAVSTQCVKEMAEGVKKFAAADVGLSISGIAGPGGGTEEKPVGLVYLGLSHERGTDIRKLTLPAHITRQEIRHRSASEALNMVRLHLLQNS